MSRNGIGINPVPNDVTQQIAIANLDCISDDFNIFSKVYIFSKKTIFFTYFQNKFLTFFFIFF